MNKNLILTYVTLLIEVLGISIIIPAFPELKLYYGVWDFEITLWLTVYSLFAFLFAPILWQRSDKIGRKTSLARCVFGTMASYFVLLLTPAFWLFLLSRTINGITGGNISIIQAIITDLSPDPASKNKHFGLMGAFFGLWFIIWPIIGSLLLQRWGVEMIFVGGGIIALIQVLLFWYMFDNTNLPQSHITITYSPFRTIKHFISQPQLTYLLISFIALWIGWFIINATQSLYMFNTFGTPGTRYGYYLAGLGVLSAINMALLVPKFWTRHRSNHHLLVWSFTVMSIGYGISWLLTTESSYVLWFYVTVLLGGMRWVLYNTEIMKDGLPHETGRLSGMMGSLQSLTMVIGPLIGGFVLSQDINIHRIASGCIVLWGVFYRIHTIRQTHQ